MKYIVHRKLLVTFLMYQDWPRLRNGDRSDWPNIRAADSSVYESLESAVSKHLV